MKPDKKQFCTFRLDEMLLGIDVLNVQEIILPQEITDIPMAPYAIRGLINLRGQVVTAIDLRKWLGFPPLPSEEDTMNVVIQTEEDTVSFLVDSIGDVLEPEEEAFELPPATLDDKIKELLLGVYKLEQDFLLVLDTDIAYQKLQSSPILSSAPS